MLPINITVTFLLENENPSNLFF